MKFFDKKFEFMFIKSRRKKYLINPKFQLSFIMFSSIVALLSLTVFFVAVQAFFFRLNYRGQAIGIPDGHIFYRFIQDQQYNMLLTFAVAAIVVLIISATGALLLSNKVAGPLYRLVVDLKKMNKSGEIQYIKFRKGDFFIEVEGEVNNLIDKFGKTK